MNYNKNPLFYILLILSTLLSFGCDENRDNDVTIKIVCLNSTFSGTYTKNSKAAVDILEADNTTVGNVNYIDISLGKANSLTVDIEATSDYTSPNDVRLLGYIIEDDKINDDAIQVDTTTGGDNASITLNLN